MVALVVGVVLVALVGTAVAIGTLVAVPTAVPTIWVPTPASPTVPRPTGPAPTGPAPTVPGPTGPGASPTETGAPPTGPQPSPTPPSAPAEPTAAPPGGGGKHRGRGFTFTAPDGWSRSPAWGSGNDGEIVDTAGNEVSIYVFEATDARRRCEVELSALQIWVPGEISLLDDRKVDGKPAPGGQLASGEETYRMRCVKVRSFVFNISLQTRNTDLDASARAFDAVLDSWRWT